MVRALSVRLLFRSASTRQAQCSAIDSTPQLASECAARSIPDDKIASLDAAHPYSLEEGIRDLYVFAITAPVSLQNRSPLSFLGEILSSLSRTVELAGTIESGPTKATGFVKTTLNGAANVSLQTTLRRVVGTQAEEICLHFLWNRAVSRRRRPPAGCVNSDSAFLVNMTLRIDKTASGDNTASGDKTVIRLSGKLRREVLGVVTKQIALSVGEVSLDLTQLESVSLEGVRFLNDWEDRGIAITDAPAYVRTWMKRERKTADERLC